MFKKFPELLGRKLDSSHYYLDNDGTVTRLGLIRIDGGGSADHVARKCREDIDSRRTLPAFSRLIEEGRFLIAVATFTDEKVAEIRSQVERLKTPVRFRLEVIPELVNLLPR
ncbi:MAG TPA: hypothetical protein VGJ05_16205 [Fimbriiglobus sp.]